MEEGEESGRKGTPASREGARERQGRSRGKGGARGGVGEDLGEREGACSGRGAAACGAVFEWPVPAGVCAALASWDPVSPSVGGVGPANCGPAPLSTPIPPRSTLTHSLWPPGPEDLI